ncbi:hypothetical protein KQX54_011178 [Cotesia glomerata]|uniref:Uncharacterized protein n=1 Tax=Cotesia glomerata TaxID=32391 RepID=A0AAV7J9E6_COTGL|nr:hypothetical protein KQX54_011178 [Cotesia glomerata]
MKFLDGAYNLEPIGSARPKFPTIDDSRSFRTTMDGSVTLLCPAQGFPVPIHKTRHQYKAEIPDDGEFAYLHEPVASTKPKFTMTEKLRAYTVNFYEPLTLFCPAQAFPVPAIRTRRKCSTEIPND